MQDCCPIGSNLGNVSKQAKLYNLIKSLAPTKLVIGAETPHFAPFYTESRILCQARLGTNINKNC